MVTQSTQEQIKADILRVYGDQCEGLSDWLQHKEQSDPTFTITEWQTHSYTNTLYEITLIGYSSFYDSKDSMTFFGKRTPMIQPIYRDYSCTVSQKNCTDLLQALAISKGTITSQFTLSNGFPEKSVGRWEMFFRLRFMNQEYLDKFHSLGLETTEPEKVVMNQDPDSYYAQRDQEG